MGRAKTAFVALVLLVVAVLLHYLGTALMAVAISLVLVPLLVLSLSYGCWQETRARARELVFFVLVATFMGLFPIHLKTFIALAKRREVFELWEIIGGLLGFSFFLFTLNSAIGHPVRQLAGERLHALPSYRLLQETKALAKKAGVRVNDILTLPAEMLEPKGSLATGLTTKNIYLADTLVERLDENELKSAVAREFWHFKYLDLWINFVVYCGWLILVSLYLSWWVIFLFGGVLFSFFLPLVGRMKELRADRYGRSLTGNPAAFLGLLQKETTLLREEPPRGLGASFKALFSGWPPLSLRIYYAWKELRGRSLPGELQARISELRAKRREGLGFLALQGLVFTLVLLVLLLPSLLVAAHKITPAGMQFLYSLEAIGLYGSFVGRVWWNIYQTLHEHRRQAHSIGRKSGLSWWGYVLPLLLLGIAGWFTYRYYDRLGKSLLIATLVVALGIFSAALLAPLVRRHAEAGLLTRSGESRDKENSAPKPD